MTMEEKYKTLLQGKKIALVGPAQSINNSNNGSRIDASDIVVRLNYAKTSTPSDSGTKTDIIYYDGSHHDYENLELSFLVCSYPKTEWFFRKRCQPNVNLFEKKYNHKIINYKLYTKLKLSLDRNYKVRPNTGLIAMIDLLNYDIDSLFITGVDFYRTGYLQSHPDYGNHSLEEIKKVFKSGDHGDYHDIDLQFKYFEKNIATNKKVILDDFLNKEINGS